MPFQDRVITLVWIEHNVLCQSSFHEILCVIIIRNNSVTLSKNLIHAVMLLYLVSMVYFFFLVVSSLWIFVYVNSQGYCWSREI